MPKTLLTRSRARPERSRPAIVFSKVGGAGSPATLSISARASAIAVSSAGLKSSTLTFSNGGTPPVGAAPGGEQRALQFGLGGGRGQGRSRGNERGQSRARERRDQHEWHSMDLR